jgi:hypothetical protein
MYVAPFIKTINIDGQSDPVYKPPDMCPLHHWSHDSTSDRQIFIIHRNSTNFLNPQIK